MSKPFLAATTTLKRGAVSGFPLNFKLDAVLVRFGRLTPATLVPSVEFCGIHPQCNVMSCRLLLFAARHDKFLLAGVDYGICCVFILEMLEQMDKVLGEL